MSNSHNSIKKDDSGEETNGLLSKRKGELSSIRERVKYMQRSRDVREWCWETQSQVNVSQECVL